MKKIIRRVCKILLSLFIIFILAFTGLIIYSSYVTERNKTERNLSSLVYDAAQTSSWTNGYYSSDVDYDSVPMEYYKEMNVFKRNSDSYYNKKIKSFSISYPEIDFSNSSYAVALYNYSAEYSITDASEEQNIQCTCAVTLEKQEDKWRVTDYYEENFSDSMDDLCELTYDIVQEASWSMGDYEHSEYSDIVSEENYESMNTFGGMTIVSYERIIIERFSVRDFDIKREDENHAVVKYVYDCELGRNGGGACADCYVTWELDDSGKWEVTDFFEPIAPSEYEELYGEW